MAEKQTRYTLVAVKSESTYGTDAFGGSAPSSSDWIAAYADTTITEQRTFVRDTTMRATHSGLSAQSYGSHCDVTVSVPLTGKSGIAGTGFVGPLDALVKASGFSETNGVYTPLTHHTMAEAPSCTVYVARYLTDGTVRTHKTTGVRLNAALSASDAQYARMTFTGIGLYADRDASPIAAPSNPATYSGGKSGLLSQGMAFAIGATDPFTIQDLSIDTAWSLEEDRAISGATSLREVHLIRGEDSNVNGSCNFRDSSELAYVLGQWGTDAELAQSATFTDGTDSVEFSGTVQLGQLGETLGNVHSYSVPFYFIGQSGNDDLTITCT